VVLFSVFLPAMISGYSTQLVEPGVGQEQPPALFSVHWACADWKKAPENVPEINSTPQRKNLFLMPVNCKVIEGNP